MTHVEFECHFAKEAERFGISKFIRENNKDYDFQSFMLSLSGIVARNESIDEEKLGKIALEELAKANTTKSLRWVEAFKAGYRKALEE